MNERAENLLKELLAMALCDAGLGGTPKSKPWIELTEQERTYYRVAAEMIARRKFDIAYEYEENTR